MNASTSHSTVFNVVAPGLPEGHVTVVWVDMMFPFGKWVAQTPQGRLATGDSPAVVRRSLRKRFGQATELVES